MTVKRHCDFEPCTRVIVETDAGLFTNYSEPAWITVDNGTHQEHYCCSLHVVMGTIENHKVDHNLLSIAIEKRAARETN